MLGKMHRLLDSINALAFTESNNIVFARGQYAPQTHYGQKLLAHELAHVVQQQQQQQKQQQLLPSSVGTHIAGTIMRQRASNKSHSGCTDEQRESVENARRAYNPMPGRLPHELQALVLLHLCLADIDDSMISRRQAQMIARKIFQTDNPDVDTVASVVERMRNAISSPSLAILCASRKDPECGNRSGYVVGNTPARSSLLSLFQRFWRTKSANNGR